MADFRASVLGFAALSVLWLSHSPANGGEPVVVVRPAVRARIHGSAANEPAVVFANLKANNAAVARNVGYGWNGGYGGFYGAYGAYYRPTPVAWGYGYNPYPYGAYYGSYRPYYSYSYRPWVTGYSAYGFYGAYPYYGTFGGVAPAYGYGGYGAYAPYGYRAYRW